MPFSAPYLCHLVQFPHSCVSGYSILGYPLYQDASGFLLLSILKQFLKFIFHSWGPCLQALAAVPLLNSNSNKQIQDPLSQPIDPFSQSVSPTPLSTPNSQMTPVSSAVSDSICPDFCYQKPITHIYYLSPQVPLYLTLYPNSIPQIFTLVQNSQKPPTPSLSYTRGSSNYFYLAFLY